MTLPTFPSVARPTERALEGQFCEGRDVYREKAFKLHKQLAAISAPERIVELRLVFDSELVRLHCSPVDW
jgi:hypothetical protein